MKPLTTKPNNNLRQEFYTKNQLLRSSFTEISPQDYLSFVFSNKKDHDELVVVFGEERDGKTVKQRGTVTRVRFGEIWSLAWCQNAYIPYCDFKNNYYHSKTLESVRGFVNDCDGVTSTKLVKILRYLWNFLPAEPTHIVNSGKGLHFVYLLSTPITVNGLRWTLDNLNKTIQDTFSQLIDIDKHPVMHPYRFPGFQTKINTTASVFQVRQPYSLEQLARYFKIQTMPEKTNKKHSTRAEVHVLPNGRRAFFEWVLRKLFKNPPIPGRRHNSFFALGIIAYKCKREVPYDEALETIPMVYEDMSDRNLHLGFTMDEAYKAFLKGYKARYVKASWKHLCDLLAWDYRPNKRNKRTRQEHLWYLQKIRKIQKEEKELQIKRLLELGYSKTQIAEILGMSRRNLYKTYGYLLKT